MTMHRYHPDERKKEIAHVLYDDCDRCSEHARNLWSLDDSNLRKIWNRSEDLTYTEIRAREQLQLWARIVDKARGERDE